MSYWDVSLIASDPDLQTRIAACAATEGVDGSPEQWAADHRWEMAAQPGWPEAWDSAVASGVENPGRDEAVISDGMILSGVQAIGTA